MIVIVIVVVVAAVAIAVDIAADVELQLMLWHLGANNLDCHSLLTIRACHSVALKNRNKNNTKQKLI